MTPLRWLATGLIALAWLVLLWSWNPDDDEEDTP